MTPGNQQQDQQIQSVGGSSEQVRDQDKIMLVLAYFSLLAFIPFLTVKDSDYVKWHAKQGVVLACGLLAFHLVIGMLGPVALLGCITGPAGLVVSIMAIVKALGGVRWRIPLIADLADKF